MLLTEKGIATFLYALASHSGIIPYPTLNPARPKAFEKVLITATFSYFVTRFTSDESANSAYASSITTIALESTDSIISRISSSGMQFPVGLLGEEIKMSFVFSLHKEIKSLTGMLKSSPLFLFTYLGTPPAIFTSDS